jgi:hypothetical protein
MTGQLMERASLTRWSVNEDARSLYPLLRNKLRKFPLLESLLVVQAYLQYLQLNVPIPGHIKVDQAFKKASRIEKGCMNGSLRRLQEN